MLFPHRNGDHDRKHGWLRTTRDVVEIVAIIAAGFWAFYIFAYENRIKPSLADPDVDITVTLDRVSEHAGLTGVRMKMDMHNTSTVRAHFYGWALWIYGSRITLADRAQPPAGANDRMELNAFYRTSKPVPVWGIANITSLGNPKTGQDLELDPNATSHVETIFYVPDGRFDLLSAYLDARYTKNEEPVSTTLAFDAAGRPEFAGKFSTSTSSHVAMVVARLDLNAR